MVLLLYVFLLPMKLNVMFILLSSVSVEITASMSCIGIGLSFLEVVLTSLFGVTTTFVVSWICLPLSSALFSLAAVHSEFVQTQPMLVYVIQLFMCKLHTHFASI